MKMNNYQLRRYLMREVHGVDIPRKPPKRASVLGTPKTARSWRYLAWIRTLPCAVCDRSERSEAAQSATERSEAAHTGSDGGMKLKASDYSAVPLCSDHHTASADSYHKLGKHAFEVRHNVDFAKLVKRLNSLWFDPENRVA
jgi:hypothetical protein